MLFLSKLVGVLSLALVLSVASAEEESYANMFDNDSDFMRGFETGLFLRSKGGKIEEYGCSIPPVTEENLNMSAIGQMRDAIMRGAKTFKVDPFIMSALNVVVEFLSGINTFVVVMSSATKASMDMYCQGVFFGLEGSKLLVKVANALLYGEDGKKKKSILPEKGETVDFLSKLADGF